jgi:hypothetical protein
VYGEAPDFSGTAYFRYYGSLIDAGGATDPVGKNFLLPERFAGIQAFLSELKRMGFRAVSLAAVYDIDFELEFAGGSRILWSGTRDLAEVLENIRAFFTSEEFQKYDLSDFNYVDFRFGNKVYYTWRNE